MSLIGSLEQFDLANILRRIELYSKSGLLVTQQGDVWIEFYFRQGQLVCIGPVRTNVTLIDRLIQANLLSPQVLPQIASTLNSLGSNETQIALALIQAGYLSREMLRAWFAHEASQILQVVFSWQKGDIYLEEDRPTPPDRLLVALPISMLLDALPVSSAQAPLAPSVPPLSPAAPTSAPASPVTAPLGETERLRQINASQLLENVAPFAPSPQAPRNQVPAPSFEQKPTPSNAESAGTFNAAQLIDDNPFSPAGPGQISLTESVSPAAAFLAAAPARATFGDVEVTPSAQTTLLPPRPVPNPLPPARIDTSFMTPDLVLVPVDLSSLRERNPQVQLTPDQWRLFSLIDGSASLQDICQVLMAPGDLVCMLAGELMAIGLVMPLNQAAGAFSPLAMPGMSNVSMPQYNTGMPTSIPPSQQSGPMPLSFTPPIETQSQWGNGNNGATFMVGGGWVLSTQQSMSQPGQYSGAYTSVAEYR